MTVAIQNKFKVFMPDKTFDWAIFLILVSATLIRLLGIETWSIWQDEETSIYFSQNIDKSFPQSFPIFFVALDWVFEFTGISYGAGRALAGFFGVMSIWVTYHFLRRNVSREVGIVAALLLTVSLGHLFWSQSIRYYTCVLAIEALALLLFFEGLEQGRYWKLVLAGICFNIALLTHFSAALLLPVWCGYLMLLYVTKSVPPSYNWKSYFAVGGTALLGLGILIPRILHLRSGGSLGSIPQSLDIFPLLIRIVAYYGAPMVAFAILSLFVVIKKPSRVYCFLLSVAIIPILELITIRKLGMAIGLWYHGFVAIIGASALAAIVLVEMYHAGFRKVAIAISIAASLYYGSFLGLYYTTMHGDRPRWGEASAYLQNEPLVASFSRGERFIRATVPEVVAHYLGVNPSHTKGQSLVHEIPDHPPNHGHPVSEWHVVKQYSITEEYEKWYQANCALKERFPAYTGAPESSVLGRFSIDRSVLVYYCPSTPRQPKSWIQPVNRGEVID